MTAYPFNIEPKQIIDTAYPKQVEDDLVLLESYQPFDFEAVAERLNKPNLQYVTIFTNTDDDSYFVTDLSQLEWYLKEHCLGKKVALLACFWLDDSWL